MIRDLITAIVKVLFFVGVLISQVVRLSVGLLFFLFTLPIFLYLPFVWFAGLFMDKKEEV